MTWKIHALLAALIFTAVGFAAPKAEACRDCPFPMKIGENQWLMPNSYIVVSIYEREFGNSTLVTVELHDCVSGRPLAKGSALRGRGERSISMALYDHRKRRILAEIHWIDVNRAIIQAKFECDSGQDCSLDEQ